MSGARRSDAEQRERKCRAIALKAEGNPEGRGVSVFLLDWLGITPRGVVAKPERQVLAELFTSMLAVSPNVQYHPIVGQSNQLYGIDGDWPLRLIEPEEWPKERRAGFVGKFQLQRDMARTITPSDTLARNRTVADALHRFCEGFIDKLDTGRVLEDVLPCYILALLCYQRLYAGALSRSLHAGASPPRISVREYFLRV